MDHLMESKRRSASHGHSLNWPFWHMYTRPEMANHWHLFWARIFRYELQKLGTQITLVQQNSA